MRVRVWPVARVIGLSALALPVALMLASFFRSSQVPLTMKAAMAGLAVWTVARPTQAALALVGTLPLAVGLNALAGGSISATTLAEVLVLTFLVGMIARGAIAGARGVPSDAALALPALCFGVTVAASAVVTVAPAAHARSMALMELLRGYLMRYADRPAALRAVWEATPFLEGMGLLVAIAAVCRMSNGVAASLTRMMVVGAAAAAALNLNRLVEIVFRTGAGLTSVPAYADQFRINVHYTDVNAAGAYFLMTLAIGAALAARAPNWSGGVAWSVATVTIGAALWLTGSRTSLFAIALVVVGLALPPALRWWRAGGRIPLVRLAIVMAILCAAGVALARHPRMKLITHPVHVGGYYERARLARASVRMLGSDPLFGIGIGRFYIESVRFTVPEAPAPENAHNNYLQIMAELGLIGLGTFLWVLAVPLRRVWFASRGLAGGGELDGVATGLMALLVVSLAMHPLLVREVAYQFWIALGLAVGLAGRQLADADVASAAPAPVARTGTGRRWIGPLILGLGAITATVPWRVDRAIHNADLGGQATGYSRRWETWNDGRSYRLAAAASTFFVRAEATSVVIPMRARAASAPLAVEILLDGATANVVSVTADRWQEVRLYLPARESAPRSRRVDLRVSAASGAIAEEMPLMVGRPVITEPVR